MQGSADPALGSEPWLPLWLVRRRRVVAVKSVAKQPGQASVLEARRESLGARDYPSYRR